MAVDFDKVDAVAATVAELYREAELSLTRRISRQLAQDIDAPGWAQAKLGAVGGLRRAAQLAVAALSFDVFGLVRRALAAAYRGGWGDELTHLADLWAPTSRIGARAREALALVPNTRAVEALADSLVSDLRGVHERVTRQVVDTYRAVIGAAVARTVTGVETRLQASQAAWSGLVSRGLVRFTDRSGRDWQLSSYVEMATRTVTARAATQGHIDAMRHVDVSLVFVTDHPQECALCRPWEGKILALAGPAGRLTLPHELTGAPVVVDVAATLAEARAAGLHHPNCRHDIGAYFPGVTRPPVGKPDPEGDKARQRQREIERRIRAAKLREAAALDDSARTAARRKVRTAQALLRDHLAANPELKRLRYREQVGAGNIPPAGRRDPAGAIGPDAPHTLDGTPAEQQRSAPEPAPQPEPVDLVEQTGPDLFDESNRPEPEPDAPAWRRELAEVASRLPADRDNLGRQTLTEQRRAEAVAEVTGDLRDRLAERQARVERVNALDVAVQQARYSYDQKIPASLARKLRAEGISTRGGPDATWERVRELLDSDGREVEQLRNEIERRERDVGAAGSTVGDFDDRGELGAEIAAALDTTLDAGRVLDDEISRRVREKGHDIDALVAQADAARERHQAAARERLARDEEIRDKATRSVGKPVEQWTDEEYAFHEGVSGLLRNGDAEYSAALDAEREAREALRDARVGLTAYRRAYALTAHEVLGEARPMGGQVLTFRAEGDDAERLIAAMRHAESRYPSEWLRRAQAAEGDWQVSIDDRGYNLAGASHIVLSEAAPSVVTGGVLDATATHELGHSMEHSVPGLDALEWALHYRRSTAVGEDGRRRLADREEIYAGSGEYGIRDEWFNHYTGKIQRRGAPGEGWEVFTTGVESLLDGSPWADRGSVPLGDADFRRFLLGVLGVL